MKEDRYEVNKPLYVIGMTCLVFGMALVMFALFIMPRLFWHLYYHVPAFVTGLQSQIQEDWLWSERAADWFVFGAFLLPGLMLGWISHWISNRLDEKMMHLSAETPSAERHTFNREAWKMFAKVGGVVFFILLIFWLINLSLSW